MIGKELNEEAWNIFQWEMKKNREIQYLYSNIQLVFIGFLDQFFRYMFLKTPEDLNALEFICFCN